MRSWSWRRPRRHDFSIRDVDRSFIGIADLLNQPLDLETMAQCIVDTMITGLNSCGSVLFMADEGGTALRPFTVSSTPLVRHAISRLEIPFGEHRYPIDEPENHIGRCAREVRVVQGYDLAEFLAPAPAARICRVMQRVVGAHSFVALPIVVRRRLAGVTLHTFRRAEISEALLDRLRAFNNLVATAIATCTTQQRPPLPDPVEGTTNGELRKLQDDFLALASHELGSPLVGMKLMLTILTGDAKLQEVLSAEQRQFFNNLLGATEHLHGLVNNIERALEFSRAGHRIEQRRVAIADLVEGVIRKLEVVAFASRAKLTFSPAAETRELDVLGNADLLEHAFWELLANAVKHGGKGVSILVTLAQRETLQGRSIELQIRDDGPGIPRRLVDQLGWRFNFGEDTEHKSTPGLGLGLFVVRRIVLAHSGTVQVTSRAEEGTTVELGFPAAEG